MASVRCDLITMEAATPLPFSQVRVVGDTLRVDGLVVHDETAVRLAADHDDPTKLVSDAIEIGVRILDREHAGANTEFVKAEFEKAASDLNTQFVERARTVAEGMNSVITRHFNDESSDAVQHKVRQIVRDVSVEMQKELRAELLSEGDENPLAKFHKIQLALSQLHAFQCIQVMRPQLRKHVQKIPNALAFNQRHKAAPVERIKRARLAALEDDFGSRNPVRLFAVNQVPQHISSAKSIRRIPLAQPFFGQTLKQRRENSRRRFQDPYGIL